MLYQKDQLTKMKLGRSNVLTKQHLSMAKWNVKNVTHYPKDIFMVFLLTMIFAIFYILHNFTVS